jgi:hypothetical protein
LVGAGATFQANFNTLTNIDFQNSADNAIKVYPNPISNLVRIEGLPEDEQIKIFVYNNHGQLIIKKSTNYISTFQINLGDIVGGIYYLRIQGKDIMQVRKISKK